ncbi:MAG: hypothetical protein E7162_03910 [Firmicutes bacterium]|nr:hypothetical protein [Bacillota bacterium]
MELVIILFLVLFATLYYIKKGDSLYKFVIDGANVVYDRWAPYSFKTIKEKVKDLGQDYTPKDHAIQLALFGGGAFIISYLYFYNFLVSIIYVVAAISMVPYLHYLRCKRIYSEFIFEQVQVYTTNTIMEFQTTQSFVKALEGVYSSGVLQDPVLSDVKIMIDMAYQNGVVDESIEYMNERYDFYMTRNMHQLFLQITKEGSRDSGDVLENMLQDIDTLVEGVYRDRMDRSNFHRQFISYGLMLYLLVMLIQYMLQVETYRELLKNPIVLVALHAIVILNSYFLISGEKYYNENVGAE